MGFNRGPSIVKDGLVLLLDTGNTKSLKGEPTTNLVSIPQLTNVPNTTIGDASVTKQDFGNGRVGLRFIQFATSNIVSFQPSISSFTPTGGSTYTFSADVRSTTTSKTLKNQLWVYVDGVRHWLTDSLTWSTSTSENGVLLRASNATNVWERHSVSFTFPTGTLTGFGISGFYRRTSNFVTDVANLQLEAKSHATTFTNGTRSSTNSLIDLTRTRSIDISNASFDSNAQMVFDGTNDYIAITDLLAGEAIGAGTQLTISLWLNCDTYGTKMPFSTGQSGADRIYYWTSDSKNTWRVGNYTSTTGHGTLPPVGTWFNTTLVINGTNITGYLNGVEDYTGSYTGFTTEHYATLGRHGASSSYYFDGKISNTKVYNKALSAQEVQQNYNSLKSRFE